MDEERKDEVYLAALAGLLHDVGKVAQRAGERGSADNETAKRDFRHYHALLTYDVIPEIVPRTLDAAILANLRRAAGYHHKPQDTVGALVQLADHLSAGEREEDEDNRVPYLESIFWRLGGREPQGKKGYLPLETLDPTQEAIFPHERETRWTDTHEQEYHKVWDALHKEAQTLPGDSLPLYLESLLDLMQRYTWCIPSAYYKNVPDVSLYDHSRTTAMLAACFAADGRDAAWCQVRKDEFQNSEAGEPVALLVAGDISGLQKFLYSLASENAARSLRGRSVYLQWLTEAVAQYLLTELGLPLTNLLYAGGGNFYLLAPVGASTNLPKLQAEVTGRLLFAHEGSLRLALAWTGAAAREFKAGAFAAVWKRLHEQMRRVKEQPLAELDADALTDEVGKGKGIGGSETACPVCGREEPKLPEGEPCTLCKSFADLGQELVHATHLVMAVGDAAPPRQRIDRWHQGLEQFGVNFWVVDLERPEVSGKYLPGGPERAQIARVYPLQGGPRRSMEAALLAEATAKLHTPTARLWRPFTQMVPLNKAGEVATFDELAEASTGIKRWGVLRMDVDNLGDLFRKGFRRGDEDYLTLSRVASLSFALRLFFEGYLPEIGRQKPEWKNRLYLQYAGGDDLFVVGAWDALPEFATQVHKEFGKYVADNPYVTLSGGISLHSEKFPLYRAAEEAGEAESKAKKLEHAVTQVYPLASEREKRENIKSKDALCFLDMPVTWEKFGEVKDLTYTLIKWTDHKRVTRALLQTLLNLYHEWNAGREEAIKKHSQQRNQVYYGPWMAHTVYQLSRVAQHNAEISSEMECLRDRLLKEPHLVELVGLAARWAELLTRSQEQSS